MSQTSPLPLSESTEQQRDSVGRQAWVLKLVGKMAVDKSLNFSWSVFSSVTWEQQSLH